MKVPQFKRPSQEHVLKLQLPTKKALLEYEIALVRYLDQRGVGINIVKRLFEYRYSKEQLREMIQNKNPDGV